MPETPEQRARREIDANLTAAGWVVQDRDELDLNVGRGIAVNPHSPDEASFRFDFGAIQL
jgi:type I restriction enzyme, R subunit